MIDRLDWILLDVYRMDLTNDERITDEPVKRSGNSITSTRRRWRNIARHSCANTGCSGREISCFWNSRRIIMLDHCPGASNLRTPTLLIKKCPQYGNEVEVFSNDIKVTCDNCGFVIYNDIASYVQWCKYAKECVGEEMYRKLVGKKEGKG